MLFIMGGPIFQIHSLIRPKESWTFFWGKRYV
jgi:hypothetical protein